MATIRETDTPARAPRSAALADIECVSCGHSDRMHTQAQGCMVVVEPRTEHRRNRYCQCPFSPDEARMLYLGTGISDEHLNRFRAEWIGEVPHDRS